MNSIKDIENKIVERIEDYTERLVHDMYNLKREYISALEVLLAEVKKLNK